MSIGDDLAGCIEHWQRNGSELTARCCYPATMAILAGHFPGQPLVPGVYHLELVLGLLQEAGVGVEPPLTIHRCKLARPVGPGQPFTIRIRLTAADHGPCLAIDARLLGDAGQAARPPELARMIIEGQGQVPDSWATALP